MLAALLKLGVLNPAGASVAELAAVPTSPVPNAVKCREQARTEENLPPRGHEHKSSSKRHESPTRVRDVSWLIG